MYIYQERAKAKIISVILIIGILVCMMPMFSCAQANAASKPASKITVVRSDKIAGKWGGSVTSIRNNQTVGKVSLAYGVSKKFKIKTYKGFYLIRVLVDGKNVGRKSTVTVKGNGKAHTIQAEYAKATLKIKVDPGHAGYYNKGAVSGYWESRQVWKLANYLTPYLNNYPGIEATMTKKTINDDPQVYLRGQMAKGNDLFLSIHSNSSSSKKTDYPLTIVSYSKMQLYNVAQPLGKKLAAKVKQVMNTRQDYQVWVKKQSDGRDWYGVIRGAASVNVPAIIIEHSFHTNPTRASWLMKNANLKKMAREEAKVVSAYYGFNPDGSLVTPASPKSYTVKSSKKGKVAVSWKKSAVTGYEVYRASSRSGKYTKVNLTTSTSFADENKKSGKKYYYKIRAYRCNGKKIVYSKFTDTKEVTVK